MVSVKVAKSKIHQKGLYANEDISSNTKIIEYVGEKITKEEELKREIENTKTGVTYIFYLDENYAIDGAVGGNDSIYVNHSCDPNCDVVHENEKIYFYSNRFIPSGEELTIDYAFAAEDTLEKCFCGSSKCRGYINEIHRS